MVNIIFLLGILAVLAIVSALLKRQAQPTSKNVTYEARPELFSAAERSFLGVLEHALEGRFRVMGKVRLGDLIQPTKGLTRGQRTSAWNRIHQKHVDFVLCQPDTLAVVGVVELDDASHRRKDRSQRDLFVDEALASADISVVRFEARKGYAVQDVKGVLEKGLLNNGEGAVSQITESFQDEQKRSAVAETKTVSEAAEATIGPVTLESSEADDFAEKEAPEAEPVCPACNSPMVKRMAKKGPYAGKWFWACSAFPKCRKVQAIE